jgi:glycosyltransferase involved in cell wall biosynthesis
MPKVSVIIPNYNHALFLEQRIQSVLEQTYQDFEIIYLDDASTDNSNQVFAKFANNPRIRAIYNQTNSGSPFKQWNKGVQHAKGEYIWIAESDDYADKMLLEKLVEKLEKNPSVGLAYCQSWKVDKNNMVNSTWQDWTDDIDPHRWKEDFINSGIDECRNYLINKNTVPNASAVVFRRSLYDQVGGADETSKLVGSDWLFWVNILLISDVAFVAEPLNYFRTHNTTCRERSSQAGHHVDEALRVMNFIASKVEIPPEILRKICQKMLTTWPIPIYLINTNTPLKRQISIHKKLLKLISLNKGLKSKISLYRMFSSSVFTALRYKAGLGSRLKRLWTDNQQL